MDILLFTSLGIFIAYILGINLLYLAKKDVVIPSLSESYYFLVEFHKGLGVLFEILLMFIVPMGIIPKLLENTSENFGIVPVVAIFGIMLVGAAPLFKSYQSTMHSVGAIGGAVMGFTWSLLADTWMYWVIVSAIIVVIYLSTFRWSKKAHLFWLEMIAFFSIYTTLIFI